MLSHQTIPSINVSSLILKPDRSFAPTASLTAHFSLQVVGHIHPECDFLVELKKNENECLRGAEDHRNETAGLVRRNCTVNGWSDPFPSYHIACPVNDEIPVEEVKAATFSLSITCYCIFTPRLRCPRNYIHIQLFLTFILKTIAIFIKDAVLFQKEDIDHCSFSTTECKISVAFCHYFMMTNFMWLLVEALYLNCLLLSSFPHGRRYFWWLVLFGWGFPTFFTIVWILAKLYFEDTACWDINQGSPYWWLIKGPIIISVGVNFILFINIIRILLKKLDPRQINFNNSCQYRRLSKSTLLLIPLFGTHYIVFNFLPEYTNLGVRLYLELCIGSFQVNLLKYCSSVQAEIGRRWHGKSYGFMPVWRKRTRWSMPSSSGIKITTSVC
uniref:Growth hormone releasing hormone receptor n=1 Tax=Chelydra serpentina TaxID=8475 RepID=A0A8C3SFT6_CHESE